MTHIKIERRCDVLHETYRTYYQALVDLEVNSNEEIRLVKDQKPGFIAILQRNPSLK